MTTFIRAAQDIMRGPMKLHPKEQEFFELVFKARTLLQQVHSKSELDINNIESLFGAFDMASLLGRLGSLTDSEIQVLPRAINYFIAKTIENKLLYPVDDGKTLSPQPYDAFAALIGDLAEREIGSVSVVTFNYDLGVDFGLHNNSIPFEYRCGVVDGLDQGKKIDWNNIDLLKLHGSLNWGSCNKCQRVCPWSLKEFFSNNHFAPVPQGTRFRRLVISERLVQRSCRACGAQLAESPVIVPPTWNKGKAHVGLSSVWRAAAAHLAEAENVFIIGYSLPITDEFFKYFYALGAVGESVLSSFCVVDKNNEVFDRFRGILGPTARACFTGIHKTFEAAIPEIRSRLELSDATSSRVFLV